jgi:hypothetical protein
MTSARKAATAMTRLLLTLCFAALATWAGAQTVPYLVNYQGELTDAAGKPLASGLYIMEFNVYDAVDSTTATWGPQVFDGSTFTGHKQQVQVALGRFNVVLGPVDTQGRNLDTAFQGAARYVGIKIQNGAEIVPRQQILATPFALQAKSAEMLANGAVTVAPGQISMDRSVSILGVLSGLLGINLNGNLTINGDGNGVVFPNGSKLTQNPQGVNEAIAAPAPGTLGSPAIQIDDQGRVVFNTDVKFTNVMNGRSGMNGYTKSVLTFAGSQSFSNTIGADAVTETISSVTVPPGRVLFNWSIRGYGQNAGAIFRIRPKIGDFGQVTSSYPPSLTAYISQANVHETYSGTWLGNFDNISAPITIDVGLQISKLSGTGAFVVDANDCFSWSLVIFRNADF